ncbi:hypothetical protein AMAG_20046 [Allomyces macrogynus ATCC 38327]|uniref:ATP-dependent RNA helicase DHX29-like UBA domain-containing protein n=1 Tax=Allomyces macrogynus (strain ATCC 38327) TaxID=578462 RepID=A0A0L0T5E0_ALLM3|nr:hypothetical protein AMAG_20046 [Allomyces macrogynus ATCC 38327]|eukprot:KNE69789.1 hypothetical protein AMAG_20046 [Allomyces macrogynus ATCC 38327]
MRDLHLVYATLESLGFARQHVHHGMARSPQPWDLQETLHHMCLTMPTKHLPRGFTDQIYLHQTTDDAAAKRTKQAEEEAAAASAAAAKKKAVVGAVVSRKTLPRTMAPRPLRRRRPPRHPLPQHHLPLTRPWARPHLRSTTLIWIRSTSLTSTTRTWPRSSHTARRACASFRSQGGRVQCLSSYCATRWCARTAMSRSPSRTLSGPRAWTCCRPRSACNVK